ncbi:cyclic nucleotide-binding domain-containing protein [bacterium AH-315-K03]|nr:cyclic nucleotide-binding domain-containing protein [bacterium AH-315-K03]
MPNTDIIEQQLLQTLVPVNTLTGDHLQTLLRDHVVESVCKGQLLFARGDYDNNNVYLLSGSVLLEDDKPQSKLVCASDPSSRFPLAHHQPRRCSATAESDCLIVTFNSDALDRMLAWDQASQYIILDISSQRDLDEDADWMLTLLRSNLFYKVPPMNIRQILNKFEPQYLSSGEIVLRQGEMGDACYFIKEGLAGVYQSQDDKMPSEPIAELGTGRFFGEDALVNDTVRNATIVMQSNGVLMKLAKQDFFLLLKYVEVNTVRLVEAKKAIKQGSLWVDVRTQDEFDRGHCDQALHMPLNLLKLKSRLLDKNQHYIIYCNSARRSGAAAQLLGEDGFNVCLLEGGFCEYSEQEQSLFEEIVSEGFIAA